MAQPRDSVPVNLAPERAGTVSAGIPDFAKAFG